MPVKIRLSRHGRKKRPFYQIVIADSRAPRDGRNIERIGIYNPNTNPATIELDFDRALDWLQKGAQPTETCRAILSYKGVLYKNHLLNGVKKGAFSDEEAEKRFQTWIKEKENKIQAKTDRVATATEDKKKKMLEAEAKVNEIRAQEIAKKHSDLAEEAARAETAKKEADESTKEAVESAQKPTVTSDTVVNPDVKAEPEPEEVKVEPKPEEVKAKAEPVKEVEDEKKAVTEEVKAEVSREENPAEKKEESEETEKKQESE
jgi:small subunit ribosomal protein S16